MFAVVKKQEVEREANDRRQGHKGAYLSQLWGFYGNILRSGQRRSGTLDIWSLSTNIRKHQRQGPVHAHLIDGLNIAMALRRPMSASLIRALRQRSQQQSRILLSPTAPHVAAFHASAIRKDLPQWPNPPVPQPVVTPYQDPRAGQGGGGGGDNKKSSWKDILENLSTNPLFGAMLTTVIGLAAV